MGRPAAAERGATAKQRFYNILGMPDLDKLREDIKAPNAEYNRLLEARKKHGDEYLKYSLQTEKSIDHAADAVKAIAFEILPITEGMKTSEYTKAFTESLQKAETFLRKSPEERLKILRERPEGDKWQQGAKPLEGEQVDFFRALRIMLGIEKINKPPPGDDAKDNKRSIDENTEQLNKLNENLSDPATFGERFGFGDPTFRSRATRGAWRQAELRRSGGQAPARHLTRRWR
jgi:hypothetical protein